MLLAENAPSQVSAEDVLWAARSATFSLLPLGWLPFFDTHFPTKLHEVLECMAAGREGGSVAVTPSQEDISSTTGAERSAARVNRQLVLQELVSAIAVGVCMCVSIFVVVVVVIFFFLLCDARAAGCEAVVQAPLCIRCAGLEPLLQWADGAGRHQVLAGVWPQDV